MPELSPAHFLGLLDLVTIDSDGTALANGESPCASGKLRKERRPNHYFGSFHPHDIPKLDYGPSGNFGRVVPERQANDLNDFALVIPLDCVSNTPVAAGNRALKKGLPGSGAGGVALIGVSPSPLRIYSPQRKRVALRAIDTVAPHGHGLGRGGSAHRR